MIEVDGKGTKILIIESEILSLNSKNKRDEKNNCICRLGDECNGI